MKTDDQIDEEALELCLKQVLDGADGASRTEQVRGMLDGDGPHLPPQPRRAVAEFCSYVRQSETLNLKPWEAAPCQRADGISHRFGDRIVEGDASAARLARKLRKASISPYHPDPLRALAEAGSGTGSRRSPVRWD